MPPRYFCLFLLLASACMNVLVAKSPPMLVPDAVIKPNDPGSSRGDALGTSVASDGTWAALGAPYSNTPAGAATGSVSLFQKQGSTWVYVQTIAGTASASTSPGQFGAAVAFGNGCLLVGAPGSTTEKGANAGAVYVFTYDPSGGWIFRQRLISPNAQFGEGFGSVLAVSGNVGAVSSNLGEGKVYSLAVDENGQWFVEAALQMPETFTDWPGIDWGYSFQYLGNTYAEVSNRRPFGWSLAVSGGTILIGAPEQQSAYVFVRGTAGWQMQQRLVSPAPAPAAGSPASAYDGFGGTVALDGDVALIGADGPSTTSTDGAAYLYGTSGSQWTLSQTLLPPATAPSPAPGADFSITYSHPPLLTTPPAVSSRFGQLVALSSGVAAIRHDETVYLYQYQDTSWVRQTQVAQPADRADHFATSLALASGRLFVGSPGYSQEYTSVNNIPLIDGGSGTVFTVAGATESELIAQPLVFNSSDSFGAAVGADRDTIVVGAPNDQDENGVTCGSVRVFLAGPAGTTQQVRVYPPAAYRSKTSAYQSLAFGTRVAVLGSVMLVGSNAGAFVYEGAGANWVLTGTLAAGVVINAYNTLALCESHAFVSGTILDGSPQGKSVVFVFGRSSGGGWASKATLQSTIGGDLFGASLAACDDGSGGHHLAVAAQLWEDDGGTVQVWTLPATSDEAPPATEDWTQEVVLSDISPVPSGRFGTLVAMSSWGVVVERADVNGNALVAFSRASHWKPKLLSAPAGASPNFGLSLSMNNNWLLVGDTHWPILQGEHTACAYLFQAEGAASSLALNAILTRGVLADQSGSASTGSIVVLTDSLALVGGSALGCYNAPWAPRVASLKLPGRTVAFAQGGAVKLSVPALPGATYLWQVDGMAVNPSDARISGVAGPTLMITAAAATDSGHYSVLVQWNGRSYNVAGFDVNVVVPPVLLPTTLGPWTVAATVQGSLISSSPAATFTVRGLPPGVAFNVLTGEFSGVPTVGGSYTLHCRATNVAGTSPELVIPVIVASLPAGLKGSFAGLIDPGTASTIGGNLSFKVTSSGAVTLQTNFEGTSYRNIGKLTKRYDGGFGFDSVLYQGPVGVISQSPSLSLWLLPGQSNFGGQVVYIFDFFPEPETLTWPLTAAPCPFADGTLTTPFAGNYTALLDASGTTSTDVVPYGLGFGLMHLNANGAVTWAGRLGDGSVVTGSTSLTQQSRIPLYLSSLAVDWNADSASGWLSIPQVQPYDNAQLTGTLNWLNQGAALPDGGFTTKFNVPDLQVKGGRYHAPARGQNVLGPGSAQLSFADDAASGDAFSSVVTLLAGRTNGVVPAPNPQRVSLQVNAATGQFSGSFKRPSTSATATFSGVLLPELGMGGGQYPLPPSPVLPPPAPGSPQWHDQSGRVMLQAPVAGSGG